MRQTCMPLAGMRHRLAERNNVGIEGRNARHRYSLLLHCISRPKVHQTALRSHVDGARCGNHAHACSPRRGGREDIQQSVVVGTYYFQDRIWLVFDWRVTTLGLVNPVGYKPHAA